jgi:hypothetical protein
VFKIFKKILLFMFRFANKISTNSLPNPGAGVIGGTDPGGILPVLIAARTGLGFQTTASLNWQDFLENTYVPGTIAEKTRGNQQVVPALAGAYRTTAINGKIDWYFSNQAMIHYVGTPSYTYSGDLGVKIINVQARIKAYINLYLDNQDLVGTIQNKNIDGVGTVTDSMPDSHDSYASTTLLLASYYQATYNDISWFTNKLPALKVIANNLVSKIDSAYNLTPNFFYQPIQITSGYQPQFYFEDNVETEVGIRGFSNILEQVGDPSYTVYRAAADQVKAALTNSLYKPSASRFDISIEKAPSLGYIWVFNPAIYYPNWQAQAFPFLYDTTLPSLIVNNAWNTFLTGQPSSYWDSPSQAIFTAATDPTPALRVLFPEGLLALAAAKNGLVTSATNIIARTESQRSVGGYVTIADIAATARAKKILEI